MLIEKAWTAAGEVTAEGAGYEPGGRIAVGGDPLGEVPGPLRSLMLAATLCNDAVLVAPPAAGGDWGVAGDPTEGALLAFAAKGGLERDEVQRRHPRLAEVPFDSGRKRMTTVHRGSEERGRLIASKGAIEAVLETVSSLAAGDGSRPMGEEERRDVVARAEAYSSAGYRVLAVAGRVDDGAADSVEGVEQNLTLYGLVAMADPPRAESAAAVAACRMAGITPVMITGDHPATGAAIAGRLGILEDREVMTGADLAREHTAGLSAHVDRVGVYARTSPEQKLDIVQAWKARGDVVAMTGDGVNDAPALRAADIGVAMGVAGTEVAKEAADMVLTDDDFASIVAAAGEGRRIYDNIRRFVRYTLTSNTGEIWVMLLGPFLGLPLPLLPVHILWINLVTDGLPGLALGVEPAERNVMRRPPRPPSESIFAHGMVSDILIIGLLMGGIPLGLGVWGKATGRPWQTMVFVSLALLQLGNAMALRSEQESLRSLGVRTNLALLWTVVGTALIQVLVVYLPFTQTMFTVDPLSLLELVVVLVASTGVFWVVEVEKALRRRRAR
jgi:Ca2+-transporting ATPase